MSERLSKMPERKAVEKIFISIPERRDKLLLYSGCGVACWFCLANRVWLQGTRYLTRNRVVHVSLNSEITSSCTFTSAANVGLLVMPLVCSNCLLNGLYR